MRGRARHVVERVDLTRQSSRTPALTVESEGRVELCSSLEHFNAVANQWAALCLPDDSPFVTHQWLRAWWSAYPHSNPAALLLHGRDGRLRAGAVLRGDTRRRLHAATNEYSDGWDVVAQDGGARGEIWEAIAGLDTRKITLPGISAASPSASTAVRVLADRGFKVAVSPWQSSPRLMLPPDWRTLLESVSRNLRSQVGRYRKRLEREGRLVFRTATGSELERDLNLFFSLEASGWKGANGTAILQDHRAMQLFTDFASSCAAMGWLRLHLLELDGTPIAADYTCVLGDGAFLMKTTYDERHAHLSPGLVLRAEALRSAVQEGLHFYDFLGGPDRYKVRWAPDLQQRVVIRAYRGATGIPEYVWRHKVRRAARLLLDRGRVGLRVAARASTRTET